MSLCSLPIRIAAVALALSPVVTAAQEHAHHPQMQEAQPSTDVPVQDAASEEHAGHDHSGPSAEQPRTPIPVLTEADRVAAKPPATHAMHDNAVNRFLLFDRLEWNEGEHEAMAWEVEGWLGTDTDRLWLRSEGKAVRSGGDHAHLELLYGHSISPWWDVLVGLRHEDDAGENRNSLALGIRGLAPQKIEVAATAYLDGAGRSSLQLEFGYEAWLSERWILHPELKLTGYGRSDPDRDIGAGLTSIEAGLRLRYEVTRQFAPYIGLEYEQAFGETAGFRRREGQRVRDLSLVLGVRFWF